jgi:hypothetical protein
MTTDKHRKLIAGMKISIDGKMEDRRVLRIGYMRGRMSTA